MARGVPLKARPKSEPLCPSQAGHADVRGHDEAARMWRTHEQSQCPDCGLWAIWTPLPAGSLVICWACNERNVDPATLGEDDGIPDEPLCAGCRAAEAAQVEADRQAWIDARWDEAT